MLSVCPAAVLYISTTTKWPYLPLEFHICLLLTNSFIALMTEAVSSFETSISIHGATF